MLDILKNCKLCERNCTINRYEKLGYCNSSEKVKVARASLHYFEEPCISGTKGSGAVFFSHCNLKCVYCQNYQISTLDNGKEITIKRLSDIFIELQEKGALNINLVTPTHYVPQIIEAIKGAKEKGLNIPIVYNTNSYENVETIKLLKDYIDIYLPDFKYYDDSLAKKYSKAPNYFEVARKAIDQMVKQTKEIIFDENGIMKKGIIIRHLILPGYIEDSKKIIKYIYNNYKDKVYISIMNQYTPLDNVKDYKEINRKVTNEEYEEVINYAIDLGVINGFIQEGDTAKESFIPIFDNEGV